MLDDVARHNQEQWDELARSRLEYTLPLLDLTQNEARRRVDPERGGGCVGARRGGYPERSGALSAGSCGTVGTMMR